LSSIGIGEADNFAMSVTNFPQNVAPLVSSPDRIPLTAAQRLHLKFRSDRIDTIIGSNSNFAPLLSSLSGELSFSSGTSMLEDREVACLHSIASADCLSKVQCSYFDVSSETYIVLPECKATVVEEVDSEITCICHFGNSSTTAGLSGRRGRKLRGNNAENVNYEQQNVDYLDPSSSGISVDFVAVLDTSTDVVILNINAVDEIDGGNPFLTIILGFYLVVFAVFMWQVTIFRRVLITLGLHCSVHNLDHLT